jgi:hypothetical protein
VYSRQEKSKLQQEFWTALGKYLSPIPSAEGLKINWINYKTGVKGVRFFMDTDGKKARIGIKLIHDDIEIQQLFFEEFKKLSKQLFEHLEEEWIWHLHTSDENAATISIIYMEHQCVNVYEQAHWPQIISFLKPRMIALDAFWCNWKYGFEELA